MSLLEKTRELQEPIRSFFWSDEPRFLCEDICFLYGISEKRMGDVSFFVAPLLTKTLPLANLPKELRVKFPDLSEGVVFGLAYELNKRIVYKFPEEFPEALPLLSEWEKKKTKPTLSEEEAHKKTLAAESWYLDWKRQNEQAQVSEAVTNEPQTVSLPLLDAMAKYQRLSEQNITEDRIMVKGESQPVRGSLRNWVRHYRDNMGIRKHTAIERGQFLFQGENTRRLGAPEREKLSLVFRSLEENEPISIDTERQEILFPVFEERSAPVIPKPETSPEMGTSFRPIEKFPASNAPIKKALEWNAGQAEHAPLFGNAPAAPHPNVEVEKPRAVGVSAPVYSFPTEAPSAFSAPVDRPSGMPPASPFSSPPSSSPATKMSFSSSHVLPHEKETLSEEPPKKNVGPTTPNEPKVMSVIRPRGDRFGFRGTPPPPGGPEE